MTSPLVLLPMGPEEERVLLEHLRQGQADAFALLYRRFVDKVHRLALGIVGDPAAAEDVTQEAFLRVYRSIHRFRGQSRLGTWIHRIATNVALTEIERRKRRPAQQAADTGGPGADTSRPGADVTLELAALLAKLEPIKRATFYLHHVEGLSAQEVAEVLDESRQAVLKRLQRTRRELVELLQADHPQLLADAREVKVQ